MEIIRALYKPKRPEVVPSRFQKIVGQAIDYRKPEKGGSYKILDTPHNCDIFIKCNVRPEDIINNFCGWDNVQVTFNSNQQALKLLRRD